MADAEPEIEVKPYEFDLGFQSKVAALTLRNSAFMTETEGLVKPEYFVEEVNAVIVKLALEHYKKFKQVPDKSSLLVVVADAARKGLIRKDMHGDVGKRIKALLGLDISDVKFMTSKVADFARHSAVEEAVLKSAELLGKGDFDKIDKLMKAALDVGLQQEGIEYSFWDEIDNRTDHRVALKAGLIRPDGITTGIKELNDELAQEGWGRKELSVLMGAAKAGKSMGLAEFAKNASLAGFNVIYFTLEVSARITADRMDANLSDTMMKSLKDTPNSVKAKIDAASARAGLLNIYEFPSGAMKASDMRRILEKKKDKGINYDLIVVDYADIMAPERFVDDTIANSRSIYLDIRGIAQTYNAALLTATQTNRKGAENHTSTMVDVAEDFNKVRTADLVISINATPDEVKIGEARLYFAAMRNSESGFALVIKQDRARMKFLIKVMGRA